MIRLQGLRKTYGKFVAVNDIDLHVARGELFGFLGSNGAGKTTTLRMIAGILRPTAGRVWLGGDDLIEAAMNLRQPFGQRGLCVAAHGAVGDMAEAVAIAIDDPPTGGP